MSDLSPKEMQRQLSVLNWLFRGFQPDDEAEYVDCMRHELVKQGLMIKQCPHWCYDMETLCKCAMDGDPANECIVMGVEPGDFVHSPEALKKFADVAQ